MRMTLELTKRQTARVIEQAIRGAARLEIEPRHRADAPPLVGILRSREENRLRVDLDPEQIDFEPAVLMGVFCEVRLTLLNEMYLFTSCILDFADLTDVRRLQLALPDTIQVANRRKFERTNATVASQIRIWPEGQTSASVGLLQNVSAIGLACILPSVELDDALLLGDRVRVNFELAGFDENFELPACVCNKALTPKKDQLTLGLEFAVPAEDDVAQHTLDRIRAALFEMMTGLSNLDG